MPYRTMKMKFKNTSFRDRHPMWYRVILSFAPKLLFVSVLTLVCAIIYFVPLFVGNAVVNATEPALCKWVLGLGITALIAGGVYLVGSILYWCIFASDWYRDLRRKLLDWTTKKLSMWD